MKRILLVVLVSVAGMKGWAQCTVYPSGVSGLQATPSDTGVAFSWTAAQAGDNFSWTVTNDSTNGFDPTLTYYNGFGTPTTGNQNLLLPNTKYWVFVEDVACGITDSISFVTLPFNCSGHTLQPGIIPVAEPCFIGASFGMPNTSIYEQYTFLKNNAPISGTYTHMPGSSTGQVSYPLPTTQAAAGSYKVVASFIGCPTSQTDTGNTEYWYFAGVDSLSLINNTGTSAKFHWGTQQPGSSYQWGISTTPLTAPDSINTTTDTFATATGLVPGTTYYLYVQNLSIQYCDNYWDTASFVATGCASGAPTLTMDVTVAVCTPGLTVNVTNTNPAQTYTLYTNGAASSTYVNIPGSLPPGPFSMTDTGTYWLVAKSSCSTDTSNIIHYYPDSGLYALRTTYVADTVAAFSFQSVRAGEAYNYTITTDPQNSDPDSVAASGTVHNLVDTVGNLNPNTKYYLFLVDSACGDAPDGVSFTTTHYACNKIYNSVLAPSPSPCLDSAQFGMSQTNPYSLYTFQLNAQAAPGFKINHPGAGGGGLSYPTPQDLQAYSGAMRAMVVTPGCPDTLYTNIQYAYFAGVVNLAFDTLRDTSVHFHWMTGKSGSTYKWGISPDSTQAPVDSLFSTTDTFALATNLLPGTKYTLYLQNVTANCNPVDYDTLSFITPLAVTPPVNCADTPKTSFLDNEIPCMDGASFGMDVTYANQSYTFYQNGVAIPKYIARPGSSTGGISYPVPADQQQYAGTYTVKTWITGCTNDTITLNPTVAYFGGVQNLTVTHYTDTSLTFSWQTAQAGSQYRWAVSTSPNGPAANSYDTTLNTSATATGLLPGTIYYIYVTNLSTCPSEADTLSFVTAIGPVNNCPPGSGPVASFTSNTQRFTVCGNGALLLESGSATGNVWWLNGQPLDSTGATLAVTQSGNYSLVVTDASGCSDTSIVQPVVLDPGPPIPTLSWTGSTMICPGSGLAITSSADDGNQWYNGNAAIPDEVNTTYVAKDAGVYWVQVTDANGCFASSTTVPVTMSADTSGSTVVPEILPAGPLLLCSDTTILLVASSAVNYQWFINGAALPGDTASTLQVNLSGNYSVATGTAGCGSIGTVSNVVAITYVGQLVPVITLTNGVLVSNYADGNQWYLNDSLIRGATKQQFTPPGPGSYTLRVEVGVQTIDTSTFQIGVGGCYSEFSLPYKITDSNFVAPQVVFYPNPVVDVLNIMNKGSGPVTIRVFNMMGAQLMERVNVQGTLQVDVRGWGKGAYIVVVTDQSTQAQQKATLIRL